MEGGTTRGTGGESITREGLEALEAEIEQLEGAGRREMAARIKTARELGDLSENADYHIAKEDQAHLETRIIRLRARLQDAVVVEADSRDDAFGFGRTAEVLEEATGRVHTWTLVGATEANLTEGRLSAESPVGRALTDAPVGKTVSVETPKGEKAYRVERILEG